MDDCCRGLRYWGSVVAGSFLGWMISRPRKRNQHNQRKKCWAQKKLHGKLIFQTGKSRWVYQKNNLVGLWFLEVAPWCLGGRRSKVFYIFASWANYSLIPLKNSNMKLRSAGLSINSCPFSSCFSGSFTPPFWDECSPIVFNVGVLKENLLIGGFMQRFALLKWTRCNSHATWNMKIWKTNFLMMDALRRGAILASGSISQQIIIVIGWSSCLRYFLVNGERGKIVEVILTWNSVNYKLGCDHKPKKPCRIQDANAHHHQAESTFIYTLGQLGWGVIRIPKYKVDNCGKLFYSVILVGRNSLSV